MKKISLFLFFFHSLLLSEFAFAQQPAYSISASVGSYDGQKVFLGYRRADKVYKRDSVELKNGRFLFEGQESLAPGIYLILLPPDNKFFEFVVTKGEQRFSLDTKAPEYFKNLKFKGSKENELLYDYQVFMGEQVEKSKKLNAEMEQEPDEKKKATLKKDLEDIGDYVRKHQDKIIADQPAAYASKLILGFREPEVPAPPKKADGTIDSSFQWKYFKAHFLDNFDFTDEVFVNTPYLKEKIDRYLGDKMTVQTPDSIISAVKVVMAKAEKNTEVFRWTLPYLLNKYYQPEIMGLDAAYVYLADTYYASGKADWASEEQLKKIKDDAYMIRGVLIGNQAPDIKCQKFDIAKDTFTNELIGLYDVKAEYTVVFLWKPGCGHCKHMTDELKPFYEEWKNKGVEIYSISSANNTEIDKAIKDIHEKNMPWIVTADPFMRARALQKFYGVSLPKIYLLDKDKKIVANRVGVAQLPQVIENHRKMK